MNKSSKLLFPILIFLLAASQTSWALAPQEQLSAGALTKRRNIKDVAIELKGRMKKVYPTFEDQREMTHLVKALLDHYEPFFKKHAQDQLEQARIHVKNFPELLEELMDIARFCLLENLGEEKDLEKNFYHSFSVDLYRDIEAMFKEAIERHKFGSLSPSAPRVYLTDYLPMLREVIQESSFPPGEIDFNQLTKSLQKRYKREKHPAAPWWRNSDSIPKGGLKAYRMSQVQSLYQLHQTDFIPLDLMTRKDRETLVQEPQQLNVENQLYVDQLIGFISNPHRYETVTLYYEGLKGNGPDTLEGIGKALDPAVTREDVRQRLKKAFIDIRVREEREQIRMRERLSLTRKSAEPKEVEEKQKPSETRSLKPWLTEASEIGPWKREKTLNIPSGSIRDLLLSTDDRHLVVASSDGVAIWDLSTMQISQDLYQVSSVRSERWRPILIGSLHEQYLAVAVESEGKILVWKKEDKNQYALIKEIPSQTEANSLAISPDGEWLVWGDRSGLLKGWNLKSNSSWENRYEKSVRLLSFSEDSQMLAFAFLYDFGILDIKSRRTIKKSYSLKTYILDLFFNSKKAEILSATIGHFLVLRAKPTRNYLRRVKKRRVYFVRTSDFSPDGRWYAEGSANVLRIHDLLNRKNYLLRKGDRKKSDLLRTLTFGHSSTTLVTGSQSGEVVVWKLQEPQVPSSLEQQL